MSASLGSTGMRVPLSHTSTASKTSSVSARNLGGVERVGEPAQERYQHVLGQQRVGAAARRSATMFGLRPAQEHRYVLLALGVAEEHDGFARGPVDDQPQHAHRPHPGSVTPATPG